MAPETKIPMAQVVGGIDINGEPIPLNIEDNGGVPVNIQDQHSEPIDLFLIQFLGNFTLAINVAIDEFSFTATAGHNIEIGNTLCFKEGTRFMQCNVLTVSTNVIGIDTPFDFAYTTLAYCCRNNKHLNIDGSVTPAIFRISPTELVNTKWDINWLMFHMVDDNPMDDSTFGSITPPVGFKGIVLRTMNGIVKNIFTARYNADFSHHCQKTEYPTKVPSGTYAFRAYKNFNSQQGNGVSIRMNSETNDTLEVIVRSDLTSLSEFHVTAHGHIVENT